MKKGDIILADFGKSRDSFEFGKKRPVVIFQTNRLNFAAKDGLYDYFLVIPLSSKDDILTKEFRLMIEAREGLDRDSFMVCNSVCFLHKRYLSKKIASLTKYEIKEAGKILKKIFDIED